MFSYILIAIGIVSTTAIYKFDVHKSVKETILDKYRRFRKLNRLVSTTYKGCGLIVYHSLCIVCTNTWLSFLQWINNSMKKIDRKTYELSYTISGKQYKMLIKPDRGPRPIIMAIDENDNDITNLFNPYLGPNNNFHGFSITPEFFGKKKIILEMSDGEQKIFNEKEKIIVKEKEN